MRGLRKSQEKRTAQIVRDTRPLGKRISDFLKVPLHCGMVIIVLSIVPFFMNAIPDIILLINLCLFIFTFSQRENLPFRMPMRSKAKDYNDLNPQKKPKLAEGIYFFGNTMEENQELWFSNTDMRTHILIFGSTGSGKTVTMVSVAYNALVQASGFIYVDGKGDNSLFSSIFSMVKHMGREDDLLLINFMTGAKDIVGPQEKRLSNTLNPFSHGSSGMLANLISGMMDSSSSSGDGDMWKGRAIAFVEALMKVLVAMRDSGHVLLDANSIRNYFPLDRIEAMVEDKTFIRDGQYSISLESLPDLVLQPIRNYLYTLPGYNKERKGRQVSQVFEQHGYITMQLTRIFTSLADTYGHILRTKLAEVDMRDVVLNRRVLVVLLPALEKSPDELANLGKIIIATLKSMMATGLGDAVEGDYQDLIIRKPTNAPTPFLCVLDEYGYYAVKGFAVVPAQARSLGFSCVFAGQDLPAFQKASKEEAASIGANTNIKICMKLEDPTETWEFFMKGAGEAYVTTVDNFSASAGNLTNTYMDTRSAKTEKRSRIDLLDLKDQGVGEMHIFFKSDIVRAKSFFANPKPSKKMRLNQMLKVDLPKDQDLYSLVKGIEDLEALISNGIPELHAEKDSALLRFIDVYQQNQAKTSIERGINALMNYVKESSNQEEDSEDHEDLIVDAEYMPDNPNIFSRIVLESSIKKCLMISEEDAQKSLVSKKSFQKSIIGISKELGHSETVAEDLASQWFADASMSTSYILPTGIEPTPVNKMIEAISSIIDDYTQVKENSKKGDKDDS